MTTGNSAVRKAIHTFLTGLFFSTTGEEPGGPVEPDYCAGGVAMTVDLFGGRGHASPLS